MSETYSPGSAIEQHQRFIDSIYSDADLDLNIGDFAPEMIYKFILASTKYARRNPIRLRPYQVDFANRIMYSAMHGLGWEIAGLFSRQSGKTETIAACAYMLSSLSGFTDRFHDGIRIGIFGPKKEQSDLAYNRIRSFIDDGFMNDIIGVHTPISNATTIQFSNRSIIRSITASKNATIEGETFDLIFVEEAQDVSDLRMIKSIFPMISSTNGTRVLTGTPTNERIGYFYYLSNKKSPNVMKVPWTEAAKYSERYKQFVLKEMKKHGPDSDWVKTQYCIEWPGNVTNFITIEKLSERSAGNIRTSFNEHCWGGLDVGKISDSTVLTVVDKDFNILSWLEIQGDNYELQAEMITDFLKGFPAITIAMDTLGPGEALYDMLTSRNPKLDIYRYPMSDRSKSEMFIKLKEKLPRITYPADDIPERIRFEQQLTELQTKWVGDKFKASAPNGKNYHDDYPCSLALAIYIVPEEEEEGDTPPPSFGVRTSFHRNINRPLRRLPVKRIGASPFTRRSFR